MACQHAAERLADEFASVLRKWLTDGEFAEMKRRNEADPAYAAGACASHDFCDANMAMEAAWRRVLGREVDAGSAADATLWNEAWELARSRHIGDTKP